MAVQYDPSKIQRLANLIYRNALFTEIIFSLLALGIFLVGGRYAVVFLRFGFRGEFAPALDFLVSFVIGLLFYFIGRSIAENLRGHAQLLLCQMMIERNTRQSVQGSSTTAVAEYR